jgi:hypothetical protein
VGLFVSFTFLRYEELSWKAKGILMYLTEKRNIYVGTPSFNDYGVTVKELVGKGKDGRDSVLSALHELEEKGIILKSIARDQSGKIKSKTYVFAEDVIDYPVKGGAQIG